MSPPGSPPAIAVADAAQAPVAPGASASASAADLRDAQFRARRLEWVLRMAPLIAGANVFNALLVLWAFWSATSHALLLGWFALVSGAPLTGVPAWRRLRAGRMRKTASRRTLRKAL